jgi:hypothetical protein
VPPTNGRLDGAPYIQPRIFRHARLVVDHYGAYDCEDDCDDDERKDAC